MEYVYVTITELKYNYNNSSEMLIFMCTCQSRPHDTNIMQGAFDSDNTTLAWRPACLLTSTYHQLRQVC